MKTIIILSFILIFLSFQNMVTAQCTGGNFGSNLNFTTAQQTIAINGNTYYTFQADSGDRYHLSGGNPQNPSELTILDNAGTNIYGYNDIPTTGFKVAWIAPFTGVFRALVTVSPCQASAINVGNMNYFKFPPYTPFPTDSAQWSIRRTINNPFSQNTIQYKMKGGDTIINGLTYSKIYSGIELNYFSSLDTLHCFIREDQRKVYVKYPPSSGYDTTEILLYNFNLEIGDTFQVRLFHFNTDSIFDFFVEDIEPVSIGNEIRTSYALRPVNPTASWGITCEILFNCIEGIGSWLGPFYNEIPQSACADGYYNIACYWEKGQYLLGGGLWCDVNTNIIENSEPNSIKIYPNPVYDKLFIEWQNKNLKKIEFNNIEGKIIKEVDVENLLKITINKYECAPGLYLIRFISDDGSFVTEKIIIQ